MLVIEKARSLAMKLADPGRVLACIPSAKIINVRGTDLVVTPHNPDEVRVLRNLGIRAPAPILHYYDWPGRFTPYEHQRLTAAFLTMNSRALVLNEIGCVDADTEYLSPAGWRRIADYTGGPVGQYWPETKAVDFVDTPEFVRLPCPDMFRIKTKHGVDQMLSPEHRMLLQSRSSPDKRETLPAEEFFQRHEAWLARRRAPRSRSRVSYSEAAIPTTFVAPGGAGIPLSDAQLRVQVAVIADGYIPPAGRQCQMRLKKQRKKDRIRDLLDAAHIPFAYNECAPDGFHRVGFVPPTRAKVFGPEFWAATPHQLGIIIDEVRHWDATERASKPRVEFFSSDKASADFVQYAFASQGYTARVMQYARRPRADRPNNPEYVVGVSTTKRGWTQLKGTTGDMRRRPMERVPSPDGFKYCFMVPSTYLILRRNGCIFATGNTGKTASALWAADYMMEAGLIKKVLVLSPLSTLERVWGDAVFTGFPHRKHVVLHGTAEKRKRLLATEADFYIVNHDGLSIIADEAMGKFDLILVDEAAVYRNPSTGRFKRLRWFMASQPDARLWLMTGTPTPNAPTDAWALAHLVQNTLCPKSYTRFRDTVMQKVGMYKWLPRPDSTDLVQQVLQPAVRYTRDECFDLPATVMQTRKVDLTPSQRAYYDRMMKQLYVEFAAERANSVPISAANEAVKLQKLVQISCGVAYDDNGNNVEIDCAPRVAVVEEIIGEVGGKVIVFVPLTGTLRFLEKKLSKNWSVAVVNGEVSPTKRNVIFQNFQQEADPKVLLAHPGTMAHGLTLTAASTVIWYGPITSNEQYVQANGRIERIGKHHVSNVVHIEATQLEHAMYSRLENKQRMQGLLLDLIQKHTER